MNIHKGPVVDIVKKYKVINCKNCGFIHINPIPPKEELRKVYSSKYYSDEKPDYIKHNLEDKQWWETVYHDRLMFLEKFKRTKTKRMLEIGSGPGLFLKYAKSRQWNVLGIEPSEQAVIFSKKNKIPVIHGFYEKVDLKKLGKFDVVAMFEFLEHIPDPSKVLKFSYNVLNKGGLVAVGVPNDYNPLQEIVRKKLKLKPYWLAPPFHINYFTLNSLTKLLERHGFKVVHKETNFPLEMFLLMGENYVGNDKVGRSIHSKRKKFELTLSELNNHLKLELYGEFAKLDIGRDITVYGKKI